MAFGKLGSHDFHGRQWFNGYHDWCHCIYMIKAPENGILKSFHTFSGWREWHLYHQVKEGRAQGMLIVHMLVQKLTRSMFL